MTTAARFVHHIALFREALASLRLPEWTASRALRYALIAVIALGGILYVRQLSQAAVSGYTIRRLEKQLELLSEEQRRLEIALIEERSLRRIEEAMSTITLVKPAKVLRDAGVNQATAFSGVNR